MRKAGHYEYYGSTQHFIPHPLPPDNPPFLLDSNMAILYGETMGHLAKLSEMTRRLPDIHRFIKSYIIKEALLSSAIEGIHTTILDVFTQPLLESKPNKNTQLVMNYTKALDRAMDMIRRDNFPITNRLILAAHEALMQVGDGDRANPGHYRQQTVQVGDLKPAPPRAIPDLMANLERYINTDTELPPLIQAGLAHVQFETIHPFLDGNGRIGRLLIVLMLVDSGLLSEPAIYPSYYFKKHHLEYYHKLDLVRSQGDFEGWITFYLTVIRDSSIDAYQRAQEIEALSNKLQMLILDTKPFNPKKHAPKFKALSILFGSPVISINELSLQLNVSFNTAKQIIAEFIQRGLLTHETQQKRSKLFTFQPYLEILEKEYEF